MTAHLRQLVAGAVRGYASLEEDELRRKPIVGGRVLRRFNFLENSLRLVPVVKDALADIFLAAVLSSYGQQQCASQPTRLGGSFSVVLSGPLEIHAGGSLAGKDSIDASSTVSNSWGASSDSGATTCAAVLLVSPIFAGLLMSIPSDNRNAEQMQAWN
jgi:hypothetical protein